jgi:hypothetical protein
MYSELIALADD